MTFESFQTFTRSPNYRVNVDWRFIETQLEHWSEPGSAVINLDPEFQRCHVWTVEQQSRYIEYILSGGMSGRELYFNCAGWMKDFRGPFVIVDGKQRLQAVRQFLQNEVPIFNGLLYKNFTGRLPSSANFVMCINDLNTDAEVLKWYLEMNTGGTPHTKEEIAKAKKLLQHAIENHR